MIRLKPLPIRVQARCIWRVFLVFALFLASTPLVASSPSGVDGALPEIPSAENLWPGGEAFFDSASALVMQHQLAAYVEAHGMEPGAERDAILRRIVEVPTFGDMRAEDKFLPFWATRAYAGQALDDLTAVSEAVFFLKILSEPPTREWFALGDSFEGWLAERRKTDLMDAVKAGDVVAVRSLLEGGVDPNDPLGFGSVGESPLWIAVEGNAVDLVGLLLEHGADPNQMSHFDVLFSALTWRSDPQIFDLLVEHGLDFSWKHPTEGSNLLFYASGLPLNQVQVLLDNGVSIQRRDFRGLTPLHALFRSTFEQEVLELFLDVGANPNVRDHAGNYPWNHRYAVGNVSAEAIDLLRQYQVDFDALNEDGFALIHELALMHNKIDALEALRKSGAELSLSASNYFTPLHLALEAGIKENIDWFLEAGVDLAAGQRRPVGTPLFFATMYLPDLDLALYERLVKASAAVIDLPAEGGSTPLMGAIYRENPLRVKALLAAGAEINRKDEVTQNTPLLVALHRESLPLFGLLLENGADPHIQGIGGQEKSIFGMVEILLEEDNLSKENRAFFETVWEMMNNR